MRCCVARLFPSEPGTTSGLRMAQELLIACFLLLLARRQTSLLFRGGRQQKVRSGKFCPALACKQSPALDQHRGRRDKTGRRKTPLQRATLMARPPDADMGDPERSDDDSGPPSQTSDEAWRQHVPNSTWATLVHNDSMNSMNSIVRLPSLWCTCGTVSPRSSHPEDECSHVATCLASVTIDVCAGLERREPRGQRGARPQTARAQAVRRE